MMIFGISKQRNAAVKAEEEQFPVMTVLMRPEKERMSYRMTFNAFARETMKEDKWTIGQSVNELNETINFLIPMTALPAGVEPNILFDVCNNGNLNNQKLWKHLRKLYNIPVDTFRFELKDAVVEDLPVKLLNIYNANVEATIMEVDMDDSMEEEFFAEEVEEESFPVLTDLPLTPEESYDFGVDPIEVEEDTDPLTFSA